jgi:tripartite-type tricarboxylate transporter receptor subunit TctC
MAEFGGDIRRVKMFLALSMLVLLATTGRAGLAQTEFPTCPLTIAAPFAVSGPSDAIARQRAIAMTRQLGQPVKVENQPGQRRTLTQTALVKAAADGHTLFLHLVGMGAVPTLFQRLWYEPQRAFEPIGLVVDGPMVLLAHPGVPASNTRQLPDFVKRNEATVTVAYAGAGAASNLCGLLLAFWHGLYAHRGTPAPVVPAMAGCPTFVAASSQLVVVPFMAEQATPKYLRQTLFS